MECGALTARLLWSSSNALMDCRSRGNSIRGRLQRSALRPVAEFGQRVTQIGAIVDAVGEQVAQPGKQLVDSLDDQHGAIASWTSAGCTAALRNRPRVSVTM